MRVIFALVLVGMGLKGAVAAPRIEDASLPGAGDEFTAAAVTDLGSGTVLSLPSLQALEERDDDGAPTGATPPSTGAELDRRSLRSVEDICTALFESAQDHDLPVAFFANLIWQESRLRDNAVSSAGARGIAQFMPGTAVEVGLRNPFDARQAIPASARLLSELRMQFGNVGLAAAAYNAGPGRVSYWLDRGLALPRETQVYVARITGHTVNEWRGVQPDGELSFARSLPCRALPAFADMEQAHFPQTEQLHEAQAQQEQAVLEAERSSSGVYRRVAASRHVRAARHAVVRLAVARHRGVASYAGRRAHIVRARHRTASGESRRHYRQSKMAMTRTSG